MVSVGDATAHFPCLNICALECLCTCLRMDLNARVPSYHAGARLILFVAGVVQTDGAVGA